MSDGATVVEAEDVTGECMGRFKHSPIWRSNTSSETICSTCGLVTSVTLARGLSSSSGQTRPSDIEIIAALAKQFNCPEPVALSWLTQMFIHFNPRDAAEQLVDRQGLLQC